MNGAGQQHVVGKEVGKSMHICLCMCVKVGLVLRCTVQLAS